MNDSFGDFNATQTAGASSETKGEGILPMLIKQILLMPESNIELFGMHYAMAAVVAIVRNIETSSTKITYLLEDHSGRIDAHYWLEEGDAHKTPNVMLNNYVKIYGTARSQGGQKTLMAFKVIPLLDPNEVTTHILEVLTARYKAEAYQKKSSVSSHQTTIQSNTFVSGLDAKQQAVFQAIKSNVTEEGISRKGLKEKFSHINDSEMINILDFLTAEGHIYSSIDPDHFICTM